MTATPLAHGYDHGSVFAYREGRPVAFGEFLSDVTQLAARLPPRRHMLNLCADRYCFAVGFSAALMREQVSLLPPNDTPDLVERLVARYPDVYCLTDGPTAPIAIETVSFTERGGGGPMTTTVPVFPDARMAAIVFTSGSTGESVPYPKTWRSLARSARAEIDRLNLRTLPGMAVLSTVPPQHSYGLESTVLMVMQGGLVMHAGKPFYPADIRTELASLPRPRCLVTTPVHLRVLLAEPDEPPSADFLLCATAPLSPQLASQAEARFNAPLFEIYGCTEAGQVAARRTVKSSEWHALPGIRLRAHGKGTWVSGGHVETEVLLADIIELRSPEKFLLHGRTSDLVNVAGKRTSLAHLNYHLNSVEGVLDGVFIVPEEKGEAVVRLKAYVVAPGHTPSTLMEALRLRIDPAFLPRPICFVDVLPRNATGKIPRGSLNQIATELGSTTESG